MKFLFRLLVGIFRNKIKIETDGKYIVFIIARDAQVDLEHLIYDLNREKISFFIILTSYVDGVKIIKI